MNECEGDIEMSVTQVHQDPQARTLTLTAEFDAAPDRVWQVWADPRQLERWWGPPTYPATIVDHDLTPGGRVGYFMTGPEGDRMHGWWRVLSVDPPQGLRFEDGFADEAGNADLDRPTMAVEVILEDNGRSGTRMQLRSVFPSQEAMDELLAMGMEEGICAAVGQIDDILVVARL